MKPQRIVTLASLAEGAAERLFQQHFAAALENLHDATLPWNVKRRLTLTLELTTKADRKVARVAISCATRLPAPPAIEAELKLAREKGRIVARSGELFDTTTSRETEAH